MGDGVGVGLEHTQEDEQGADHHASSALACLAVDDNDGKLLIHVIFEGIRSVILLHSLQEQGRIHTKSEYFLQIGHIVVQERKSTDGEWAH